MTKPSFFPSPFGVNISGMNVSQTNKSICPNVLFSQPFTSVAVIRYTPALDETNGFTIKLELDDTNVELYNQV